MTLKIGTTWKHVFPGIQSGDHSSAGLVKADSWSLSQSVRLGTGFHPELQVMGMPSAQEALTEETGSIEDSWNVFPMSRLFYLSHILGGLYDFVGTVSWKRENDVDSVES